MRKGVFLFIPAFILLVGCGTPNSISNSSSNSVTATPTSNISTQSNKISFNRTLQPGSNIYLGTIKNEGLLAIGGNFQSPVFFDLINVRNGQSQSSLQSGSTLDPSDNTLEIPIGVYKVYANNLGFYPDSISGKIETLNGIYVK